MIRVTSHACDRYLERVDGRLTFEQARAEIASHERAIEKAAAFRCETVKLGNGARLVLDGTTVVTVMARGSFPRCCRHPHRHAGSISLPAEGRRPDHTAAALIPLRQGA